MSKVTLSALSRTYTSQNESVCNQYSYISNESNNSMLYKECCLFNPCVFMLGYVSS